MFDRSFGRIWRNTACRAPPTNLRKNGANLFDFAKELTESTPFFLQHRSPRLCATCGSQSLHRRRQSTSRSRRPSSRSGRPSRTAHKHLVITWIHHSNKTRSRASLAELRLKQGRAQKTTASFVASWEVHSRAGKTFRQWNLLSSSSSFLVQNLSVRCL